MDILEHLGMKVPDIEGHGVIISRANEISCENVPNRQQVDTASHPLTVSIAETKGKKAGREEGGQASASC